MHLRVSKASPVVPLITQDGLLPSVSKSWGVKFSNTLGKKWCCFGSGSPLSHYTANIAPLSPTTSSAHVREVTWHSIEEKLTWYTYELKFDGWEVQHATEPMTGEQLVHWGPGTQKAFFKVTQGHTANQRMAAYTTGALSLQNECSLQLHYSVFKTLTTFIRETYMHIERLKTTTTTHGVVWHRKANEIKFKESWVFTPTNTYPTVSLWGQRGRTIAWSRSPSLETAGPGPKFAFSTHQLYEPESSSELLFASVSLTVKWGWWCPLTDYSCRQD